MLNLNQFPSQVMPINSKVVGYTSGVYDMFHIGHLNLIKQAHANCDFLIVSVTTDDLSLRHKGKKPIIPFENRLEIIRALKFVDLAVPQKTMNKIDAWKQYQFNKIFVGSDWKNTESWNALEKDFSTYSVEICYFEYTKNISSTFLKSQYCIEN